MELFLATIRDPRSRRKKPPESISNLGFQNPQEVFMKLYVGNLAYTCTDEDLNQLFGEFGSVAKAYIVKDRESQRSKGFGFVEMGDSDAQKALSELNGREFMGRPLNVSEARPAAPGGDRGPRRSFGGGDRGPRRDGGGNGGPRRGGFRDND